MTKYNVSPLVAREIEFYTGTIFGGSWCRYFISITLHQCYIEATNGEPPYPVIEINRKGLAHFLNDDQGYESGISMYGHYIACKCLDISSEREYMNRYTDIRILTNESEPC